MRMEIVAQDFSVCKVSALPDLSELPGIFFVARTEEELSLVCQREAVPSWALEVVHDWCALRVAGTMDFSLVGVLARIADALAVAGVPIFAASTFDTDYVLVRAEALDRAVDALRGAAIQIT